MLQLALDFLTGRKVAKPARATAPNSFVWKHGLTVKLVRPARARRYLLRLNPDGTVRLAIPRRGSKTEALRFLERSEAWLLKRREQWQNRVDERQPWQDGTPFLYRGEMVTLRVENGRLSFAEQTVKIVAPHADYRAPVLAHLRRLAERELPARTLELAARHGVTIKRVSVRAQKTRWGSCSARGTISLNWRIVQAPILVRDYLIVHELMHCREMNHSRRYWKLVAEAFPEWREAERWLKSHRLEALG